MQDDKKKYSHRPGSRPLQLVGRHGGDGRAPTAFVRDPVQRVLGRVLTVTTQATPKIGNFFSNLVKFIFIILE